MQNIGQSAEQASPALSSALLLTPRDLAAELRVSLATIWRLRAAGKLPRALTTLGKQLLRWHRDEIKAWIACGMPDMATWEAICATERGGHR